MSLSKKKSFLLGTRLVKPFSKFKKKPKKKNQNEFTKKTGFPLGKRLVKPFSKFFKKLVIKMSFSLGTGLVKPVSNFFFFNLPKTSLLRKRVSL